MNRLYSILTYELTDLDDNDYYWKKRESVDLPLKARELVDELTKDVPYDRLPLFACFLCHALAGSTYDIESLDPDNTYAAFGKDPSKSRDKTCVYDLLKPAEDMSALTKYLDKDLKDELTVPTWLETAGACCMQLLRWCSNG